MDWLPSWQREIAKSRASEPPPRHALSDEEEMEYHLNRNAPRTLYGRTLAMCPSALFMRTRREPLDAAMDVLHEARHAWQLRQGWTLWESEKDRAEGEADAEAYCRARGSEIFHVLDALKARLSASARGPRAALQVCPGTPVAQ
jgi:hypothetical protein